MQRHTLYGAACAYLLLGLAFTALYVVLEHVHPPALVTDLGRRGRADLAWVDVVFFSFMTLTTVGYGDITPVSPEARLVALFEAVAGVFFLAFLVARLVALYRTDAPGGSLEHGTRRLAVPQKRSNTPTASTRGRSVPAWRCGPCSGGEWPPGKPQGHGHLREERRRWAVARPRRCAEVFLAHGAYGTRGATRQISPASTAM